MTGVLIILHAIKLFENFKKTVTANKSLYLKDYLDVLQMVSESPAQYMDKPIDFLYQPMFFDKIDVDFFYNLSEHLVIILKKVVTEYRKNLEFRKKFHYSQLLEDLVLSDPGYGLDFPVARFDFFYHSTTHAKFCELNTDGTSSMHEAMELYRIFSSSKILSEIDTGDSFYDFEIIDSWIECLLKNYNNFKGKKVSIPNVAIVDFIDEGIVSEFEVFRDRLIAQGYNAIICDPRELKYIDGNLYFNEIRIDLIYRRAVTARLAEEAHAISDFLRAYKEGSVCVVGGLVSQIVHNKILFAVLHDEGSRYIFTPDELNFIKNHIPYTKLLSLDDKNSIEYAIQNKDSLILKPCDLYAAKGVFVGKDTPQEQWDILIKEKTLQHYIIQEFCPPPRYDLLVTDGKDLHFEPFNVMIGLFMYNEKFKGIYSRVGRQNIIANISESFTLPNFVTEQSFD